MATKPVKQEVVRVRITEENKNKLRKIAKLKNKTMSEIICSYIDRELDLLEFNINSKEIIEKRSVATDEKLKKLKEKMRW